VSLGLTHPELFGSLGCNRRNIEGGCTEVPPIACIRRSLPAVWLDVET
jgi:hypothetical protein